MNDAVLIESRVDYLTATCLTDSLHDGQSFERALQFGYDMVQTEHRKGNDKSIWRSESFEGFRSGQICVGRNERGLLFRLSGQLAANHWRDVYQDASNVSRIDCAATVRLEGRWLDLSRLHHDEALLYQKERSPHLRVTRIDGGKHGNTLNVGSRSSEGYGRIYDKWSESHVEEYRDCWRYEVEFKKRSALFKAAYLASEESDDLLPAAICMQWFKARGVRSIQIPRDSVNTLTPYSPSDDERRLAWISKSVAPLLRRLIDNGRQNDVMVALGFSGMLLTGSADEKQTFVK